MVQRFITGTSVFDTYAGVIGEIVEVNLQAGAVPDLAPLYTGPFFVVQLQRIVDPLQVFTVAGRMVVHSTGVPVSGVTLVTQAEYTALLTAGYPK